MADPCHGKMQEEESEVATEVDILIEEVIPEGSETEEVKEEEEEEAQAETTEEDTADDVVHEGGRIAWTPSEKEEEVMRTMELTGLG